MNTSPKPDYARDKARAINTPRVNRMELGNDNGNSNGNGNGDGGGNIDNINKIVAGGVAAAAALSLPAYLAYNKYVNPNDEEQRTEVLT
jgi:hypothetical protein